MAAFSHAWWLVVHPVQRSFLLCWFLQESEISCVEQLGGKTSLLVGLKAGRRRRPLFSASSKVGARRETLHSSVPYQRRAFLSRNGDLARQHLHLRPLLISASSILACGAALPPTPGSASTVSIISILASALPTVSQLDWLPCRLQPYFCLPSMWWACITEALKFYMFLFTSDPLCTTQLDKLPC